MKKLIKVTPSDIKEGERIDCNNCPIALAVNRVLTKNYHAVVTGRILIKSLSLDKIVKFIERNKKRNNFIGRFDAGKKVKPFAFYLDIPKKLLKVV